MLKKFVDGAQFFITIYRHIGFGKSEHITNAKTATLVQSLIKVKRLYKSRGFKIQIFMVDSQFDPIKSNAENAVIAVKNISRDEHKPVIER